MKIINRLNLFNINKTNKQKDKKSNKIEACEVKTEGLNALGDYNRVFITKCSPLDKYQGYYSSKELSDMTTEEFIDNSDELFKNCLSPNGFWLQKFIPDGKKCAWKMHIYSDNIDDWKKLSSVILPYLNDNNITWKTLNLRYENNFEILNQDEQKGKAYTIYPKSNQEFEKIAKDINYIIKNNNLTLEDSKIQGDRRLGSTGRLFYRYEYKTKDLKDAILDLYNTQDAKKYIENYETNRNGDNYLASDMTIDDDPWYNFEP